MVRQNYSFLDPSHPHTWALVGGERRLPQRRITPAFSAAVEGHSGTGKTDAIHRCLQSYPRQVIDHETFPHLKGGHKQVVWQSVDVPPSGRMVDLASSLMWDWNDITHSGRFTASLAREKRDGMRMLDEWRQVASSHFLGLLHLDEVQNFFKLAALKTRKKTGGSDATDAPLLSIVEDQMLKWILTLTNTGQIPLLFSGHPMG